MPTRVRHAPTRPGDEQPTAAAGSGGAEIWLTMDVPPEPELTDDDSEDEYYFATTLTRLTLTTTWLRLTLTRQTPARMVAETPAGTPNLTWRPWTATAPEFCVFWPDLCVACPCLCCNLCCNSGLTARDQCSYVLFCIIALPLPPAASSVQQPPFCGPRAPPGHPLRLFSTSFAPTTPLQSCKRSPDFSCWSPPFARPFLLHCGAETAAVTGQSDA